jgi:hypothetical protein
MAPAPIRTPVAMVLFRRPDRTARVFEQIRAARPRNLILIADGPRNPAEGSQCEAARAVVANVDWDCEVTRDYASENLGLKKRITSGLDLVFDRYEEAIILEDDCLPSISFFRYCQELLDRYRENDLVMHIAGSDLLGGDRSQLSYRFTRYPHIWGWATWRSAWQTYDPALAEWHAFSRRKRERRIAEMFAHEDERRYWRDAWDASEHIDNWDFRWSYALLSRNGLATIPNRNLVTNIGFGSNATNALDDPHGIGGRPRGEMAFPLRHPTEIQTDPMADAETSIFYRRPESSPPWTKPAPRGWSPRESIVNPILRAGGRALEHVPARIRPRIRDRDRRSADHD